MNHNFNIQIAKDYGLIEAILLENIAFWMHYNIANEKNKIADKYWIFNSVSAWKQLFPYLTASKIRYALQRLVKKNVLLTGVYNKAGYDKTKWYTINPEIFFNRFLEIDKVTDKKGNILHEHKAFVKITNGCDKITNGLVKITNGCDENNKPIPIINTDVNTNINTIPEAGETAFSEEIAEQLLPKETLTNKQDKLIKTKKVIKESNEPAAPVKILNDMFAGLLEANLPGAQYSFKIGGGIFQRLLKTNSLEKLQDIIKAYFNDKESRTEYGSSIQGFSASFNIYLQKNVSKQNTKTSGELYNLYQTATILEKETRPQEVWEAEYLKKNNAVKI